MDIEKGKIIGTCGHELSEEWFGGGKSHIMIKDYTREGEKCVSSISVCENCRKNYEQVILETSTEEDEWFGRSLNDKPDYKKPQCHLSADTKEKLIELMEIHLEMLKEGKPDIVVAFGEKPVCETCEGSKKVPTEDPVKSGDHYEVVTGEIPCPTCQQPPASEFVEKNRMRIVRDMAILDDERQYNKAVFMVIGAEALEHLGEACDLLDAQQQQLEELDSKREEAENLSGRRLAIMERFESQLAKWDKAIKYLNKKPDSYETTWDGIPWEKRQEELKRILGDQWEEIVKDE